MSNGEIRVSITEIPKIREALEKADKEIERLNKCIKDDKENADEIIVEQQKEIERLKQVEKEHQRINGELREELKELKEIQRIGREREYHSKFLKDFQKERGKNVFPDHDEIYKRYDDYKSRVDSSVEYIEDELWEIGGHVNGSDLLYDKAIQPLLDILKGNDKE